MLGAVLNQLISTIVLNQWCTQDFLEGGGEPFFIVLERGPRANLEKL